MMALQHAFNEYLKRLTKRLETLPEWGQALWALTFLACLGIIGGQIWLMTVGHLVAALAGIIVAWLIIGRWWWAFLSFVILSGGIWVTIAEHPVAAAMVVAAVALLTLLLRVGPAPEHQTPETEKGL